MRKSHVQRTFIMLFCVAQLFSLCTESNLAFASSTKVTAILRTNEGMKVHDNGSPRRLMHDVLLEEFARRGNITILNKENSPNPVKNYNAPYHIGANLIAFAFAENSPTQLSISIALVKESLQRVVVMESKALIVPKADVESGLKLKDREFDNSNFGKAVAALTRAATKEFEEKVMKEVHD